MGMKVGLTGGGDDDLMLTNLKSFVICGSNKLEWAIHRRKFLINIFSRVRNILTVKENYIQIEEYIIQLNYLQGPS